MKTFKIIAVFCTMYFLFSDTAYASGSDMPWETPLDNILQSMTGPVAKVAGVSAIVMAGLALAFSEGGGFVRKIIQIVFGLSIAFSASSFFLTFFGFGGGLVM